MVKDQVVNRFRSGNKNVLVNQGLFQLRLIQDFSQKKKIPLSNVKVIRKYFDVDLRYKKRIRKRFSEFPVFNSKQWTLSSRRD